MIRRFGDAPQSGRSYITRPGAYAVLWDGKRVLLTHQAMPVPELQLPGGGIDPGESGIQALHREVREETGWSISLMVKLGTYRRFTFMPEYDLWAEKICHIFLARPVLRHGPPTERGHRSVHMSPRQAVAALDNSGDQHFARMLFAGL